MTERSKREFRLRINDAERNAGDAEQKKADPISKTIDWLIEQGFTRKQAVNPAVAESELREAYRRAGLWRIGMSFAQAISAPLVRRALTMAALARRRREKTPTQLRLI